MERKVGDVTGDNQWMRDLQASEVAMPKPDIAQEAPALPSAPLGLADGFEARAAAAAPKPRDLRAELGNGAQIKEMLKSSDFTPTSLATRSHEELAQLANHVKGLQDANPTSRLSQGWSALRGAFGGDSTLRADLQQAAGRIQQAQSEKVALSDRLSSQVEQGAGISDLRDTIAKGADPNGGLGASTLELAARKGDAHMLSFLLQNGARAQKGDGLMTAAAQSGKPDAIKELLKAGVAVPSGAGGLPTEAQGALWSAVLSSSDPAKNARAMIAAGADPNARADGQTPLQMAQSHAKEAVDGLLDAGANPWDEGSTSSPLYNALTSGNEADARKFLQKAAPENKLNGLLWSLTRPEAKNGMQTLFKLQPDLDPNREAGSVGDGMKAMDYAIYYQNPAAVKALLDAGADMKSASSGRDPFLNVLDPQLPADSYNRANTTPRAEIIGHLLAAGANPNATVDKPKSPDYAGGVHSVYELLRQRPFDTYSVLSKAQPEYAEATAQQLLEPENSKLLKQFLQGAREENAPASQPILAALAAKGVNL